MKTFATVLLLSLLVLAGCQTPWYDPAQDPNSTYDADEDR